MKAKRDKVGSAPADARLARGHGGLWAALFGAGAATAAIFALRPAQSGAFALDTGRSAPAPAARREPGGGTKRSGSEQLGYSSGAANHSATDHAERRPASKRIIVGYGFWIFLLSDIIMFAAFFASYAVLSDATAGGPSGQSLFDLRNTGIETACLLVSSFTCGLASLGLQARNGRWYYGAMTATFVLGTVFIGSGVAGVLVHGRGRQRPRPQRLPVSVLRIGWPATGCTFLPGYYGC